MVGHGARWARYTGRGVDPTAPPSARNTHWGASAAHSRIAVFERTPITTATMANISSRSLPPPTLILRLTQGVSCVLHASQP